MFSYRILIVFSPIFYNCFLIEKLLYFHRWFCAENTMKIQAVFLKYCHNTIHRRNLRNIHVVFLSYCHKFFVSWEYNDNPMRIQREFIDDFRWVPNAQIYSVDICDKILVWMCTMYVHEDNAVLNSFPLCLQLLFLYCVTNKIFFNPLFWYVYFFFIRRYTQNIMINFTQDS